MRSVCRRLQISPQSFYKRLKLESMRKDEECQIINLAYKVREDHPQMSARKMYKLIQPESMGRDKFEQLCYRNGLKLIPKKSYYKTTDSNGTKYFKNHLEDKQLTGVNQAWVSDISYYRINNKFYYLTFIMDLYSREIIGYNCSDKLYTEKTTIPALKMAIKKTGCHGDVIIHSDGGGQYYSKEFLKLTKNMTNSMCKIVYDNAHAERLNGTIKNEYLHPFDPKNYIELKSDLKRAVILYNESRPHNSLGSLTPKQYGSTSKKTMKVNYNNMVKNLTKTVNLI